MKHKIYAQVLLTLSVVVSCSEVPPKNHLPQPVEPSVTMSSKNSDSLQAQIIQLESSATPEQRDTFVQAEKAWLRHDTANFVALMSQLKDYPLYPYLQAQWLRKNLAQTEELEDFLTHYKSSREADALRQDWLLSLAKNQQWEKFIQYYDAIVDDKKPALQCYFAQANYSTNQQEKGLLAAKDLWQKNSSEAACNEVFAAFVQSSHYTEAAIWQRFSAILSAKKPNVKAAANLKLNLSPQAQTMADVWLKIAQHQFGIALNLWAEQKPEMPFYAETRDFMEQQIGLGYLASGDTDNAYAHLNLATHLDESTRHSLLRTALRAQNWQHVLVAFDKLSDKEKTEERWQYWHARALAETGQDSQAREIFTALSKKCNYYAFLAADKLNIPYQVTHVPVPVSTQDITALQQQADMKMVTEWFLLNRQDEALKQWWHTVKKLSPKQIMAAAKLAQHWQMHKLAAFTLAKADYWQDLELRFPIAFSDEIQTYAAQNAVDPALIFGLIRQESVFDAYAGSNVGARGLMQIMPATGKQIARQLQESWSSDSVLYQPEANIKYGTFYYKQLLDKFDGQAALAAAGYNAGPGRVKNWRPNSAMPMDIWIETIPFNETRQYVSMVLSNALFYQYRMNRNSLKISDFMREVQP